MSDEQKLKDLDFIDLYICLEGDAAPHYHNKKLGIDQADISVPAGYADDVEKLRKYLLEIFTADEIGLSFDGMRLCAAKARTSNGQLWAALRRISSVPAAFDTLGFPPQMLPPLEELGTRDGLILVCSASSQGKTTTATALLSTYLKKFSGVCFSIEDPVEFDLEGPHGNASYCYQTEVSDESQWADAIKRSLRWHPRYIFVGDVRTPEAASRILQAADSGHLVIATMTAGSLEEGLESFIQLADQIPTTRANIMLASSLTCVIHQAITPLGLNTHFFITEPANPNAMSRAAVRERRYGQVKTMSDQQMSLLLQTGKVFR